VTDAKPQGWARAFNVSLYMTFCVLLLIAAGVGWVPAIALFGAAVMFGFALWTAWR
jgi:hypothetical protein